MGVEKPGACRSSCAAQAIRELVSGLERIHSHLLWAGCGLLTKLVSIRSSCIPGANRETVMNILENLTGNRVHYSANVLGGREVLSRRSRNMQDH